ncbi:hypothetical protein [Paenibacillus polymyxa]
MIQFATLVILILSFHKKK